MWPLPLLRRIRGPGSPRLRPTGGDQASFPFPVEIGSRAVTLTVGPLCELDRGHWVWVTHRRGFATRRSLDRHLLLGEHRLIWLCWATAPNSQTTDPPTTPMATNRGQQARLHC
jgi:hypothetical protein